jgi:hypothetical protein
MALEDGININIAQLEPRDPAALRAVIIEMHQRIIQIVVAIYPRCRHRQPELKK